MRGWRIGVLLTSAAFGTQARAEVHDYTLCVQVDVTDFGDHDIGDFWTGPSGDGQFQPVRGVEVSISSWTTGGVYNGVVFVGNTSETTGCVTRSLDTAYRYEVYAWSKADVNGVPVEAYEGATTNDPATVWVKHGSSGRLQLIGSGPTTAYFRPADDRALMEIAVGTYAMSMSNQGLGAGTPLRYNSVACCSCCNDGSLFIRGASSGKYAIAHETGHGVAALRDGGIVAVPNYDHAEADCRADFGEEDSARWSKEWASAALVEGWADFYADWVFNDDAESDCEHPTSYIADLDLDGNGTDTPGEAFGDLDLDRSHVGYNCEGIPLAGLQSYVTARDWLADVVNADDTLDAGDPQCGGTLVAVGSIFDAERYFWDMLTDEDVSIGDLVDLFDLCDPRNWATTVDNDDLSRNPFRRLAAAADEHVPDLQVEHANQENNGVDHGP